MFDPGSWNDSLTNASNTAATTVGSRIREGSAPSAGTLTLVKTQYKVSTTNLQTVVITQVRKDGFTTTNDNGDGAYVYTSESANVATTRSVTYTNTREELPVELHVAFSQNGAIDHVDNAWRSETTNDYTVAVAIGLDGTFAVAATNLEAKTGTLIKAGADLGDRRFMGVYYGRADESNGADENRVAVAGKVTSVGFVKPDGSDCYELCLNGYTALRLGDYKVYCVYCAMPRIYYVATGANGALTKRATVTFEGEPVSMGNAGEAAAAQGTLLEVGSGAAYKVAEGTGTGNFHVPMVLDGVDLGSLDYIAFGAGAADVASTNQMNGVTHGRSIQLKVADAILKWSADGETWEDFTGAPAVYAIYKEIGHDLTIAATALASEADKAVDTFTLTIQSDNLTNGVTYLVSGYPEETVTPNREGVIILTLTNGCSITIQSLPNDGISPYVFTQTLAAGYSQTNVTLNGFTQEMRGGEGTLTTFMERDNAVAFTNIKVYNVTFLDEDGETELKRATPYWFGTKAGELAVPGDPSKDSDGTRLYRFTDWSPAVEDVGSNAVYVAAYRAIKIPEAAQRSADTNLVVRLDDEQTLIDTLRAQGIDLLSDDYSEEAANEFLNAVDPNGLRHWENLVTGSDTNQLVLGTATGSECSTMVHLAAGSDDEKYADLGYIVLRDLRKLEDGKWSRKDGPKAGDNPDFDIPLLDGEGKSVGATGLYRVYTLIIPKHDLAITNEIPSTNIIGVLEIASTMTNTLAAVPWHAFASDPAHPTNVSVAAWAQKDQLAGASFVRAVGADGGYEMWQFADDIWTAFTTTRAAAGGSSSIEAADASTRKLPRGAPVWLTRSDVSKPFFLVGQYAAEAVTETIAEGDGETLTPTLLTNPTFLPMAINELTWGGTPDAGDQILIPTEDGTPTVLQWNGSNWGASALEQYEKKNGRMGTRVVRKTDFAIPPGRGFWYYRKAAGTLSVTFPAIPCN